jgi:hypothetical protein
MSATDRGQFCELCQREVIDFSRWSDAQIRAYLRQHAGRVCGKLRPGQLQRPLQQASSGRAYAWLLGLLALGTSPAVAQDGPPPSTVQVAPTAKAKASSLARSQAPTDSRMLQGQIVDETDQPAAYPVVIVAGTQIGTYGAADGTFRLMLPTDRFPTTDPVELHVNCLGYVPEKVWVQPGQAAQVRLRPSAMSLGEVVIIRTPWQAFWYRMGGPWRWMKRQGRRLIRP